MTTSRGIGMKAESPEETQDRLISEVTHLVRHKMGEAFLAGKGRGATDMIQARQTLAERRADIFEQRWTRLTGWLLQQQAAIEHATDPESEAQAILLRGILGQMRHIELQPLAADEEQAHEHQH